MHIFGSNWWTYWYACLCCVHIVLIHSPEVWVFITCVLMHPCASMYVHRLLFGWQLCAPSEAFTCVCKSPPFVSVSAEVGELHTVVSHGTLHLDLTHYHCTIVPIPLVKKKKSNDIMYTVTSFLFEMCTLNAICTFRGTIYRCISIN